MFHSHIEMDEKDTTPHAEVGQLTFLDHMCILHWQNFLQDFQKGWFFFKNKWYMHTNINAYIPNFSLIL